MNYRLAGKVKRGCYAVAVVLAVLSIMFPAAKLPLLIAAFAAMVAGLVVQMAYYRCPHCKAALPANAPLPETCPQCRMKLK